MMSKSAVLVFNGNKHCFVTLPRSFVGKLPRDKMSESASKKKLKTGFFSGSPVVIELQNAEGHQLFTNWNGAISIDLSQGSEVVEVNGLYGNKQGFQDGETVVVTVHQSVVTCENVHVEPLSVDDWEILEMHAAHVESSLLSSLRVVWKQQTFPVWVHRSLCIFVKIRSMEPESDFCLLEQNSEVIVAPKARAPALAEKREEEEVKSGEEEEKAPKGRLDSTVSFLTSLWKKDEKQTEKSVVKHENSVTVDLSLSVAALEDFIDRDHQTMGKQSSNHRMMWKQSTNVVVAKQTLQDIGLDAVPHEFLAQIQKIPSPNEILEQSKKDQDRGTRSTVEVAPRPSYIVRVLVVDNSKGQKVMLDHWLPPRKVLVNRSLRKQLGLDVTGRIRMTSSQGTEDVACIAVNPLSALPDGFTSDLLEVAFRAWLKDNTSASFPLIVDHSTVVRCRLKPDSCQDIAISVHPSSSFAAEIHTGIFPVSALKIGDVISPTELFPSWKSPREIDPEVPEVSFKFLGGVTEHRRVAMTAVDQCLGQRPLARLLLGSMPGISSGALLVCGSKGVGKTAFVKALCNEASKHPNMAFISTVHCKTLRGKRIESLRKYFEQVLHECAWRQPSVLLLDDLDHIAASPAGPDQEMTPDAIYYSRVAQVLKDLFKAEMREGSRLSLVISANSRSAIHHTLSSPTDFHLFKKLIQLHAPDQTQRFSMLESLFITRPHVSASSDLDLHSVASLSEGFVARDLESLVDRALHAHLLERPNDLELTQADFTAALEGFTPASLRSITLHQEKEGMGWEAIGGLHDVRSTLVETLQWPAKYPELFSKCPLRVRSGLLLYGAPGTGKTLLASAVAKECALNFISIKGPELLSKYIGASEQAVRDIFARAQSAKPCILFFDEFESLAPRRGHDSTGVTDRVVNQLLTQLDGVEGLEGVYVLGATSRPDLIDPALLRPGRLDKALHCNLPSADEQLEIVKALTRNMSLSEDVDLPVVISQCQHFTGADFKALLYNAQLEAIHDGTKHLLKDTEHQEVKTDIAHMPSIEDGVQQLTKEDYEALADQVTGVSGNKRSAKRQTLIQITQRHLVDAAKNMTPSVSEAERMRFHIIYKMFVASRGGNFTDSMQNVGKRATLA